MRAASLEEQNRTRVPELVPIHHGRMIVSPFTFYRGVAAVMAWDLSRTPTTGLRVQCCGDAHLSSFGVFAAPDRRLVFDLNDFAETLPAPFEWDVKRLVASIVVAARGNGHRPKEQRAAARATVAAYRRTMAAGAAMRFLEVWYTRVDVDELFANLTANADAATTLTPDRRIVLDHYHYEDFARKVVGVGTVGTEAFMLLLMGDLDDDPLFLQIKEATTSELASYAGASDYDHQGERVVQGQRLVQAASDALLGWVTGTGEQHREFYVRQLRDMKGWAVVETMPPSRLALYGQICGATLAPAHARTGDAAKITGYLGDDDTFDRAIERFAVAYADQNDADYAAFSQAADEHRIAVQRGV